MQRTHHRKVARYRDVVSVRAGQIMAGHKNLETTQRYIDADDQARRKVVQLIESLKGPNRSD